MPVVWFRFYGELNDFLPPVRRRTRFACALPRVATAKDSIESLGAPHPEIDLILVNGQPRDFACRLQDGDSVSVFPRFRSIDLGDVARVGVDPPRPVRFALDVHLGKLASLLRLAGFDAVVDGDDAGLAQTGAADGRVVLTRDIALLKRGTVTCGYWVRHMDPEQQLAEVLARFSLADSLDPFTRCLRCNHPLAAVDADAVAGRVLPRTRAAFSQFQACPGCARVYWQGSHYQDLLRTLERVRERITGLV